MILHLDFETRSKCDLKKSGAWRYSIDPSTEILCFAYAYNDGSIEIMTRKDIVMQSEHFLEFKGVIGKTVEAHAHNANFEMYIWENILVKRFGFPKIDIAKWRCSAARSAALSLPRKLERVAEVLRLSAQKDMEGHRLMLKMSKPRKPTKNDSSVWHEKPEDFEKLYRYCINDVAVERAIDRYLPALTPREQTVWRYDQIINRRGVMIDYELVTSAIKMFAEYELELTNRAKEASNFILPGVGSRDKLIEWLKMFEDVELENAQKATVRALLANPETSLSTNARAVLEIRQQLSQSSVKKYQAMESAVDKRDMRIRGTMMYHAAGTGRWGGRIIQPQNFPRGTVKDISQAFPLIKHGNYYTLDLIYGDIAGVLSSAIRGAIIPRERYELFVADYAAIEARVLVWLAGDLVTCQKFNDGVDLYVDMAKKVYHTDAISKTQRAVGKQIILACGYSMGGKKFKTTCDNNGIPDISEELAIQLVKTYRDTFPLIPKLWKALNDAAVKAIRTKQTQAVGKIKFGTKKDFLVCQLPSGRCLTWFKPRVVMKDTQWGARPELRFMGEDLGQWRENKIYGGLLAENCVQAIARDLLAEAIIRCEDAGYPIILHVHDELVAEVPKGEKKIEDFEKLMAVLPDWAEGCPVKAEGFVCERYRK